MTPGPTTPGPTPAPTPASILDGLREILARMGIEQEVTPDTRIRSDLDLDSLRRIELVIEVENRFRVRLEPEDEAEIETVGDLVASIRRRGGSGSEAGG